MSARRSLTRGIGELLRLLDPGLSDLVRTPHCDVCGDSTTKTMAQEYGTLSAHWGYGSVRHDGERYEVHLCEDCFFETLASLRQSHRSQNMFEDDYVPADPDRFGRVE